MQHLRQILQPQRPLVAKKPRWSDLAQIYFAMQKVSHNTQKNTNFISINVHHILIRRRVLITVKYIIIMKQNAAARWHCNAEYLMKLTLKKIIFNDWQNKNDFPDSLSSFRTFGHHSSYFIFLCAEYNFRQYLGNMQQSVIHIYFFFRFLNAPH